MKNIKLIALIFLTILNFNLLYSNSTGDFIIQIKNKDKLEITGGGKLSLPFIEGCFYINENNINYGVILSNKDLHQKITINTGYGKFSYTGIVSKINNPLISSSISPFSTCTTNSNNVSVNFPGYSSFSNPTSFFVTLNSGNSKNVFYDFHTAAICIPKEKYFFNFQTKFKTKLINGGFSNITGFVHNDENANNSWFFKNSDTKYDYYFHEDKHFCNISQISLFYKKFSALETIGLYQGLFGESIDFIAKTENKITVNKTILNFSALINTNQNIFLSSSNKKITNCVQSKISFQKRELLFGKISEIFRYGAAIYFDSPIFYYSREELNQIGKAAAGIQWIGQKKLISLVMQADFLLFPLSLFDKIVFNGITSTLKTSYSFEKIKPSATFTFHYKKNETNNTVSFNEKLALSVSFCKNPSITISSTFNCNQKNYQYDYCNLILSASVKLNLAQKFTCSFLLHQATENIQ